MNKDFLTRIGLAQSELKAPKNQYNSFGKYSYRSCEDILEAAKPVCAKYGLMLTVRLESAVLTADQRAETKALTQFSLH